VPNNMVIAVSGDVEVEETCGKLKNLFKGMARRDVKVAARPQPVMISAKVKNAEMYREESLVLIGFLTVGVKDADRFPLDVLGSVLSGQSGRLFRDLRDTQALAYTLGCAQMLGPDTGYMVFYAATTGENIERTRKELLKEIKMVRDNPPGEEELRMAKAELVNRRNVTMQSNFFFAFEGALAEISGLGYESLYRYKEDIETVTREDLRRVALSYLDPDKRAEVLIASK